MGIFQESHLDECTDYQIPEEEKSNKKNNMTKKEAEKIYDKIQVYYRAGYVAEIRNERGITLNYSPLTQEIDGISILDSLVDGNKNKYYPRTEAIARIQQAGWQIIKTTFILDLIEGYKEGDMVKVRPGYIPEGRIGTVTATNKGNVLVDFGYIDSFVGTIITFCPSGLEPYFPEEPPETIKIGDAVYNKKEFEGATKDLKPIE